MDAWTESAQITDGHEVEDHSQFYSIVRLSPGHRPSLHKPTERPKFERYHQGDGLDHRTNVQFYERESDTGAIVFGERKGAENRRSWSAAIVGFGRGQKCII